MEIWNHGLLFGEDKIKINIKEFDAAWCVGHLSIPRRSKVKKFDWKTFTQRFIKHDS